jgi:hypothetical protein
MGSTIFFTLKKPNTSDSWHTRMDIFCQWIEKKNYGMRKIEVLGIEKI